MDIKYKAKIRTKNNRLYTINYIVYASNNNDAMKKFGTYLLHYIPNAQIYYKDWISMYDGQIYYIELMEVNDEMA